MRPVQKDYGETNFITGMRAFAALGVLMIHAGGAGLRDLGVIGNNIADMGRTGVYVFFVISGFSVAASFEASRGYFDYLGKRLWRVVPLYYFWILIAVSTYSSSDAYNLLMHLGFVSFLDYKITNSIIAVEWSIPIEVFWYVVVPALIVFIHNKITMAFSFGAALLTYLMAERYATLLPVPATDATLALHWSPIPYVLSYSLGVTAYKLRGAFSRHRASGIGHRASGDYVIVLVLVLLVAFVVRPDLLMRLFHDEFIFFSVLTFLLLLFGSQQSRICRLVFTNKPMLYLGVMSYGIYLSHVPLIGLLTSLEVPMMGNPTARFLIVTCAATALSTLTYHLIERPGLALGTFLQRRGFLVADSGH